MLGEIGRLNHIERGANKPPNQYNDSLLGHSGRIIFRFRPAVVYASVESKATIRGLSIGTDTYDACLSPYMLGYLARVTTNEGQ